jgi:hypothetical protein
LADPAKGDRDVGSPGITPENTELNASPKVTQTEGSPSQDLDIAGLTVNPYGTRALPAARFVTC